MMFCQNKIIAYYDCKIQFGLGMVKFYLCGIRVENFKYVVKGWPLFIKANLIYSKNFERLGWFSIKWLSSAIFIIL